MLSYKDKSYCASPHCKNECGRKPTEGIQELAEIAGLPICYAYFCGEPYKAIEVGKKVMRKYSGALKNLAQK